MNPRRNAWHGGRTIRRRSAQRGFALVAAVLVMVVLSLLGAWMLSLSNTQRISSVRDLLGSRAYYAARAGMEWGAYQAMLGNCSASAALPSAVAATGFDVQVACARTGPLSEGSVSNIMVYEITATASTGSLGAHDYAERQLQAIVSTP
jgi:MSHA biogenesis protein MshP